MFHMLSATYKKNRLCIKRAMPWAFILSRVLGGVSAIVFPYFIYHYFLDGSLSPEFAAYTGSGDYMTYIVLGAALDVLSVATLMNVGRALITELREGTIEPLLLSPAPRMGYFLGCLCEQTARALLEFAAVVVFGAVLGANVRRVFTLGAVFAVGLAIFSFFCMGLLLSSLMLRTRDTYIVQNTLFNLSTLLCGVAFPLQYLPRPSWYVAQAIPLTPAVSLFRAVVMNGGSLWQNGALVAQILVLSIVYAAAGLAWFRHLEKTFVEKIFA